MLQKKVICLSVCIFLCINYIFFLLFSSCIQELPDQNVLIKSKLKRTCNQAVVANSICKTIHAGFVAIGYMEHLKVYILLKSIYFYRSKPLHFHIMVDNTSVDTMKTLFETWNVAQVKVTYYSIPLDTLKLLKESNYNSLHINSFMKMKLASVVSNDITEKLIILDVDLNFSADIYELWILFNKFDSKQAIGLAKLQGGVTNSTIYNTGVSLYHLKKLQDIDWYSTWYEITHTAIWYTNDQENILNLILARNSKLVYVLPCEWNVQLNKSAETKHCYTNYKVKVIYKHFHNSMDVNAGDDENSFSSLHAMFFKYNGNLLRYELPQCKGGKFKSSINNFSQNPCQKYDEDIALNRRTLMYFRKFDYEPCAYDVTLVSQLSYEKLLVAQKISEKWNGPISFTIYLSDYELQKCIHFIENSKSLSRRFDIAYNVVFREGMYFPINSLRNISMRTVVTPYIFLVDIDLIPSSNLYENLKFYISKVNCLRKKALVVPAFETKTNFPNSKIEALAMLSNKTLKIFHHDYQPAYGPTNYKRWKSALLPYPIQYYPRFEPYVVVQSNVSEFDKRFIGFGFNKASHTMLLNAQEYKFFVLPDVFVTHKHHIPSISLRVNLKSRLYRRCKYLKMQNYFEELTLKYGIPLQILGKLLI